MDDGGTADGNVITNDVTGADGITGVVGALAADDYTSGDIQNVLAPLVSDKGTLTLNADGSYSYVADQAAADALAQGETATDTFTYTVTDGNGGTEKLQQEPPHREMALVVGHALHHPPPEAAGTQPAPGRGRAAAHAQAGGRL